MSLPAFYPQRDLVVSTIRGSTAHQADEVADWLATQLAILERQRAAGLLAAERVREQSRRKRSAVLQAVGLEPMKAGPNAGKRRLELRLSTAKWAASVVVWIEREPRHYGLEKAPGKRFVEDVLADLRQLSTAAK